MSLVSPSHIAYTMNVLLGSDFRSLNLHCFSVSSFSYLSYCSKSTLRLYLLTSLPN